MPRVYLNLLIVWLLTGFWHGAGWNFIIWGLFLFVCIAVEKAALKKLFDRVRILGHIYMIFLIPLSWMIFAITDIDQLGIYIERLFDFAGTKSDTVFAGDFEKYWDTYGVLMIVCPYHEHLCSGKNICPRKKRHNRNRGYCLLFSGSAFI